MLLTTKTVLDIVHLFQMLNYSAEVPRNCQAYGRNQMLEEKNLKRKWFIITTCYQQKVE